MNHNYKLEKNNSITFYTVLMLGVFRGGNQTCVKIKAPGLRNPEQDKQIRKWMDR